MSYSIAADIGDFFESNKSMLDKYLNSMLERDVDAEALEVSRYIAEGGKRIRGLLMLYFTNLLNGSIEFGLPAAASLELVHSCSLAIDDIIDADVVRRGKPSAWVNEGLSRTVLVSNLLIPIAIKTVEYLGDEAVKLVVDTWLDVTRGEIADVFSTNRTYLEVVALKTSSLFQLSLMLSAIAAKRKDLMAAFKEYGLYLGYIYQISDDVVDVKDYLDKGKPLPPFAEKLLAWLQIPKGVSEWELILERAKPKLLEFFEKTLEIAKFVGNEKLSTVLEKLPVFIADKILGEGGLSWRAIATQ
jgi:geranylgeranyl pyrophosphate synthase|uniref:Polyprenyl synthetase family protein n=1 Tax=Fervidicoccus fontis TaxID=683846 RepID=A0A7J3SKK7_9CREN